MSDTFDHEGDAWASLDWDDGPWTPNSPTCRYCGTKYLYWKQTDTGWRLTTRTGALHTCEQYKARRQPPSYNPVAWTPPS